MPQVLVRDVDSEILERLKKRARSNGRSLQSELKTILEGAARQSFVDARAAADRIRRSLARGGRFSDSTLLIRRDRRR